MIPADLLSALREKDPELYILVTNNDHVCDLFEAWLLYCLMQAIRARGWLLELSTFTANPTAKIWKKTDPAWRIYIYRGVGEIEAEALLRAYLAAREAALEIRSGEKDE